MAELAEKLPLEYEYLRVDTSPDSYQIRVKGITTAEEANAWLDSYSDLTMTTWRVNKTYPHSGRINVFKRYFRCQRKTDGRHRGLLRRTSKNTDCPAQIEIVIKRYNPRSRSKYPDRWTEEYPAFIRFRKNHNHTISDAEALKHRDMSVDTREKLISLFRAGHAPSSARNFLKMELLLNHPESVDEKMTDAHYVPSISVVTHLYKTVLRELGSDAMSSNCSKVTARELKLMMGKATVPSVQSSRSRVRKRRLPSSALVSCATNCEVAEVCPSPEPCVANEVDSGSPASLGQPEPPVIDWCRDVVDEFCARVKQGIADNPRSFVPAVQTMHHNLSAYAVTEAGLLATLYTMGYLNSSECTAL